MAAGKLRTGVVGCGVMGKGHVKALLNHADCQVVALCDANPAGFADLPADLPRYASAEEMFAKEKLDLVNLNLPNFLYESHVALAARHKTHVVCEKPFGQNLASARSMVHIAREGGIRGFVGGQFKYHSHFLQATPKIRQIGAKFVTGGFYYCWSGASSNLGWRGDKAKGGGLALIDNGWHSLDCVSHFLGHPESVYCKIVPFPGRADLDLVASLIFTYADGTVAQLQANPIHPIFDFAFTFIGLDESVHLSFNKAEIYKLHHLQSTIESDKGDLLGMLYTQAARALRGEPAFITTFEHAEKIMRTVEACYRSAAEGRQVQVG